MKSNRAFSNPGLKVVSLVIAFALWLVIMNLSNPVKVKTFTGVQVNITNASYVESQGLSYKIASGSNTINVTVNSNRSVLERLSNSGITVTADLTQIIDFDSDPVMVPVTVSIPGVSQDNIVANPRNIEITLEDMISQDFVINTTTGETSPGNGYEIGSITSSPEKITLRGPKSLIEKIDKVVAQVDVSGIRQDTTLGGSIRIYDKNGDVLDDSQMNYLTPSLDYDEIKFQVTLYEVLADVPITAEAYGTPAEGYMVGEITVTPSTIKLVGNADALAVFKAGGGEIVIDEASCAVDISGASEDQDINVQITDYIPSDLRLAADLSEKVVVNVQILEQNTQSFEFETKRIVQNNLSDNLIAVFKDSQIDLRIRGSAEDLERLDTEEIEASVDFTGIKAGDVTVPVSVTLPEGYSLAAEVTADVSVAKQETVSIAEE